MSFNSLQFLIFLPSMLLLYFIVPHKIRWIVLLAGSYYAYMSWNVWLVFLILGTTVTSYLAGLLIPRTEKKGLKKFWLILTLIICLGMLVFFKYFNFLIDSVTGFLNLFSMNIESPALDIILPVGISFYTFQTLSYVIDVYRGTISAEKHFGYYALFVSYFPQLVAGPIERPENLIPQLKEKHKLNREDLSVGFRLLAVGFFRKCVVADFCGVFVNSVFANYTEANTLAIMAAALLFSVQIYCDFAGYSEIAMGVARMMGIKLTRNFDRPFSSTSLRELCRRWHITLNSWFKDYLYIPLGGSRKGKWRMIFNVVVVYALSGLWHGANWTYVLWGVSAGVFIVAEGYARPVFRKFCKSHGIDTTKGWTVYLRRAIIVLLMIFSSTLFRSTDLVQFGEMWVRIFTTMGFGYDYVASAMSSLSMTVYDIIQLVLILGCMLMLYNVAMFGEKKEEELPILCDKSKERSLYARRVATVVYMVIAVALSWLILLSSGEASAFVYFQF